MTCRPRLRRLGQLLVVVGFSLACVIVPDLASNASAVTIPGSSSWSPSSPSLSASGWSGSPAGSSSASAFGASFLSTSPADWRQLTFTGPNGYQTWVGPMYLVTWAAGDVFDFSTAPDGMRTMVVQPECASTWAALEGTCSTFVSVESGSLSQFQWASPNAATASAAGSAVMFDVGGNGAAPAIDTADFRDYLPAGVTAELVANLPDGDYPADPVVLTTVSLDDNQMAAIVLALGVIALCSVASMVSSWGRA